MAFDRPVTRRYCAAGGGIYRGVATDKKNSEDDHDLYFPLSPLTVRAIESKWLPHSDAIALQAPINVLVDYHFLRGNFGRSAINSPFSFRAMLSERQSQHTSYLDRQIFKKDVYELTSETEMEVFFGFSDYVIPGFARVLAPEIRSNTRRERRPIWQKLQFRAESHLDIETRTDASPHPRTLISASQCERIHHAACTRSSRNPIKVEEKKRLDDFVSKLRYNYGSNYNVVKCCQHSKKRLINCAHQPCNTNRSHYVSTVSNLDLLKKTKDGKHLKHFFLISHDATSRLRDIWSEINNQRFQDDLQDEEIESMIPTRADVFFAESFGDMQRCMEAKKVSLITENPSEFDLLRLSPDFNEYLSRMENNEVFGLGPPLPNPSQLYLAAYWLVSLIHRKIWPPTMLDDDDQGTQRACFEPGKVKRERGKGEGRGTN